MWLRVMQLVLRTGKREVFARLEMGAFSPPQKTSDNENVKMAAKTRESAMTTIPSHYLNSFVG